MTLAGDSRLPRRRFVKGLGAAAGAAVLGRAKVWGAAGASRRPNVLVMIADDQRADAIHALGNDHIRTPALDRLVAEGFTFTRARNMGAQTGAVCVPARAMLHTGRTLFRAPTDMKGFALLAETFGRAGYRTFACGKWHN